MSTISISSAMADLFSAPLKAVVEAETAYLALWRQQLEVIKTTYLVQRDEAAATASKKTGKKKTGGAPGAIDLALLLDEYAPVVRLEGRVDTALTMRIAGVRETSGTLSAGLSLGPIHAAGGYGFVSRSTQESVFQASTSFVVSNKEFSLRNYLEKARIDVTDVNDLDKAIAHLDRDLRSRELARAESGEAATTTTTAADAGGGQDDGER